MRIFIIGSSGIPAKYGGFETLVENLVVHRSVKIEYTVFCSTKIYSEKFSSYSGAKLKYINLHANGIGSIVYDLIAMILSLGSDAMLILGVSGSLFLPVVRLLYRGRIITNIDGMEWKRNKWNKFARYFLRISEKTAVKYSDIVICDNQGILDYVKKEYGKESLLIEYGADHVMMSDSRVNCCSEYAITVCRIEPENNIDIILDAFSRQNRISIKIIGNWKNSKYGIQLFKKYENFSHIILLDPIYDYDKINILRSRACLYIHGHSAGGTNPSLVEAMFMGLPIFAFDCIYNRYTTENQCRYWSGLDELCALITGINFMDLKSIARRMKSIADRRYRWENIVKKYEALF
jgi:glycosyltransferase involved in cell wall biosynthesis